MPAAMRCDPVRRNPSWRTRTSTGCRSSTSLRRTMCDVPRATMSGNMAAVECCREPSYRASSCVCVATTGVCKTCHSRRSGSCTACLLCARESASSGRNCWQNAGRIPCTHSGTVSHLDKDTLRYVTSSHCRHLCSVKIATKKQDTTIK